MTFALHCALVPEARRVGWGRHEWRPHPARVAGDATITRASVTASMLDSGLASRCWPCVAIGDGDHQVCL